MFLLDDRSKLVIHPPKVWLEFSTKETQTKESLSLDKGKI